MSKLTIHTDGASRGNPGDAGIGVVIADEDGSVLREISEYVGKQTSNFAEYSALIVGLRAAAELGAIEVEVCTDSELMANQIAGIYRVKSANLEPLYNEAMSLLRCFRRSRVSHVCREANQRADQLATDAAKKKPGPGPKQAGESDKQASASLDPRRLKSDRRRSVQAAVRILQEAGAREVYMFGSVAEGRDVPQSDVDLAVRGLPPELYYRVVGKLLMAMAEQVDLIDLDDPSPFVDYLLEEGRLVRVA